jgi:hypothetical protein
VFPSSLRGFSVAMLPLDSKTINLPFPLMLPAKDSAGELETCAMTESICPNVATENTKIATIINARRKVTNLLRNQAISISRKAYPRIAYCSPKTLDFMRNVALLQASVGRKTHNCFKSNSFDAALLDFGCHFTILIYHLILVIYETSNAEPQIYDSGR